MVAPLTTGNTLLPPPRLTGDAATDVAALHRYIAAFFAQFAQGANVIGTVDDHASRIAALEADIADLTARVAALESP